MSDRIEAAARAIYEAQSNDKAPPWEEARFRELYEDRAIAALGAADAWDAEHGIRHVELKRDGEGVRYKRGDVGTYVADRWPLFRIVSERKEDS